MAKNIPKVYTKTDDDGYTCTRDRAQVMTFEKLKELLQRNVNKNSRTTFIQYTKDLLKTYIQSPEANQHVLRDVSKFLERNSMLYKKLLNYYASMPLFRYNITEIEESNDETFDKVLRRFDKIKFKDEGYNDIYVAMRDGAIVSYVYDSGNDGTFSMELDLKYIRIYGSTPEGMWIVYMDAAYFDQGNNKDFVTSETGRWDDVFVKGYEAYRDDNTNCKWFRLPPEKVRVILSCPKDQFRYPLPYFLPIFCSLLDLLDLEQILQDKNELENYKLIVNKIPILQNSDEVDDFAISLELAEQFDALMNEIVPDLVGVVRSPMDIETIEFNKSASDDTNELSKSIENLFSNVGASRLVIASGSSTNATGLKYSVLNDMSNCWIMVDQISDWWNYFLQKNVSSKYELYIHKLSWYNEDDYIKQLKDLGTLGMATPMDILSAINDSPFIAWKKIHFETRIGIYDILRPLMSSYNTNLAETGRPKVDDDVISDEGQETRDKRGQSN